MAPADATGPDDVYRTPRWVKVFAILGAVIVALLFIGLALGAAKGGLGGHGPGRHFGGDEHAEDDEAVTPSETSDPSATATSTSETSPSGGTVE